VAAGLTEKVSSVPDLAEMVDAALPKPGKRGPCKKAARDLTYVNPAGDECRTSAVCQRPTTTCQIAPNAGRRRNMPSACGDGPMMIWTSFSVSHAMPPC
jgi:hypothetical protein